MYKGEPLYQIVTNSGNQAAIESFDAMLESVPWAVYRVRRIYKAKALYAGEGKQRRVIGSDPTKKGRAERCVEKLETCRTAEEAMLRLRELAKENDVEPYPLHGLWYAHIRRCETQYPTAEDFLVAAPADVETKARYGVEDFDEKWQSMSDLYCGHADLPLFASLDLTPS